MPTNLRVVVVEDLIEDSKAALTFISEIVKNHPDKNLYPTLESALQVMVDSVSASISTMHLLSHVNKHSLAEAQADYLACVQGQQETKH